MIFAAKQFKKEFRGLIGRWKEESDLTDDELILAAVEALNAYREEPVVDFEADPNFFENDDVDNQEDGDDI